MQNYTESNPRNEMFAKEKQRIFRGPLDRLLLFIQLFKRFPWPGVFQNKFALVHD
jgi:hypothetical protein